MRKKASSMLAPDPPIDRISVEVEPISNGFIATHTHSHPKKGYEQMKVFHKTDPRAKARPGAIFRAMRDGAEGFTQDASGKKAKESYTQDRKGKKKAETYTQKRKK